jgi:hypothetical protein
MELKFTRQAVAPINYLDVNASQTSKIQWKSTFLVVIDCRRCQQKGIAI